MRGNTRKLPFCFQGHGQKPDIVVVDLMRFSEPGGSTLQGGKGNLRSLRDASKAFKPGPTEE